jgi:peptide/nickel transport system ATP-binding protein
MYAGDIVETADVREIFSNPLHPYTQGLLRSVPKVEQAEGLNTIPGTVPGLVNPPSGCRFHPRCPWSTDICAQEKPSLVEMAPGHWVACHTYARGTDGTAGQGGTG